jgi:hypothetical protein
VGGLPTKSIPAEREPTLVRLTAERPVVTWNRDDEEREGAIAPSCSRSTRSGVAWPDVMRLFPPKFATTGGPEPYQSLVCCVPIPWLEKAALIERAVDVVGAQLRLPLKMGGKR